MSQLLDDILADLDSARSKIMSAGLVWPIWDTAGVANSPTYSNNGRTVAATSASGHLLRGTIGFTGERRQGEILIDQCGAPGFLAVGLIVSTQSIASPPTSIVSVPAGVWLWRSDQNLLNNGGYTTYGPAYMSGDRIQIAVDETGNLWFGRNDVYLGDPVAGTSPAFTGLSGQLALCAAFMGSDGSPKVTLCQGMQSPLPGFDLWGTP